MKKVWFIVILFFCLPAHIANTDHLILVNLTTNQLSFFEDENIY